MKLDVTTQEGYDIACALRGPDFDGATTLKYLFTAYLRSKICGMDFYYGAARVEQMSQVGAVHALAEARTWSRQDSHGYWHYLNHARRAARALGDLALDDLGYDFQRERLDKIPTIADIIELGGGDASEE